ncbi:PQQ-binding-like beta-propeller repeat protein [Pseudonocardia sp. DSM 110487]|uniref:serine/threonine-protein kinase n=1 Tax=Pseudonocardia sp. DSM 110487 TaxID=2865833 RepID=UPI001C6A8B85|nr:serine/threonine-protein kinase [Pseudonocardia sp. DSM 110487]QYN32750.1 PQQ-binding-like beta-propeller repeat protein [Pseudonocardia sp. DSM 110487]
MLRLGAEDPYQVGPFRLLGRLGSGGMGQVFLGVGLHRELVAVKLIHRTFASDPGFRARFRHEVTAGMRVRGGGTAPVVAADPDAPIPWLATEYVPGPSLDRAVRETGPLPQRTLHVLAAGLAAALTGIHAVGLLHRDVKPPNVLLAGDGPRLIDMGISRAVDATQLSATGAVVGTPAFMSPEQAEGLETGPASDVFSLGAVLAYAALGRGPFGDANPLVMLRRIVDDPADLHGLAGPLRGPVEACLAKRPADRPTAAELTALLGPVPTPPWSWLPASVAALFPPPPDVPALVAASHARQPPVPARRAVGRRALLVGGAGVLGLAALGGTVALARTVLPPPRPPAVPDVRSLPVAPTPTSPAPASAAASWTAEGPPTTSALRTDGHTVYAGGKGTVVALDATTGRKRWEYTAPPGGVGFDPSQVRFAIADGTVYLATNGAAIALDAATGRERWRLVSDLTEGYRSLAGIDVMAGPGVAYFAHGPTLFSMDPATGDTRWTHVVDGNFAASPEIDGDHVLISNGNGVDALLAATGELVWRRQPDGGNATELGVAHGIAFLTVNVGGVVALDTPTGAVRWQAPVGSGDLAGAEADRPVVVDDAVIVRGRDEQLHAFEISDGTPRWSLPDRTNGGGTAKVAPFAFRDSTGGLVYTGDDRGRIYAFAVASGTRQWAYAPAAGFNPVQVITAADRVAFVAGFDGRISAIRPE